MVLEKVEWTWIVVELQPKGPLGLGRGCVVKKTFEGMGVEDYGICEGI